MTTTKTKAQIIRSGGGRLLRVAPNSGLTYFDENGKEWSLRSGTFPIEDVDTNERGTAVYVVLRAAEKYGREAYVGGVDGEDVDWDEVYSCGCPVLHVRDEGHQEGCRTFESMADYRTGLAFHRGYASWSSILGYQPPVEWRKVARTLEALGKFARESEQAADLASKITRSLGGRGLTEGQFFGSLYRAASEAVKEGFFDVVLKASPEPGRPSSWEKAYSDQTILRLAVVLSEITEPGRGLGWVLDVLVDTYKVRRDS